eukprot:1141717-Pelagomonas_calceolata.AAC.1
MASCVTRVLKVGTFSDCSSLDCFVVQANSLQSSQEHIPPPKGLPVAYAEGEARQNPALKAPRAKAPPSPSQRDKRWKKVVNEVKPFPASIQERRRKARAQCVPSTVNKEKSMRSMGIRRGHKGGWPTRGLQGVYNGVFFFGNRSSIAPRNSGSEAMVGLQPETLADQVLVKQSHPASKIETNSDRNIGNLYESWFKKH